MRFSPRLLALPALVLTGCPEEQPDTASARGDLGRGHFVYECVGDSDVQCSSEDDDFPQAVAVGSRFGLRFAVSSGAQPSVISGAPSFAKPTSGAFLVAQAGDFAMLAVNGNREVVDLKHLHGSTIADLRVQSADSLPSTVLRLQAGEERELQVIPVDDLGARLAGALEYEWESSDEDVAKVDTLARLSRIRVRVLRAGTAQLSVSSGALATSLTLEVRTSPDASDAGAPDQRDADPPAEDASSETGEDDAALPDADMDGGTP